MTAHVEGDSASILRGHTLQLEHVSTTISKNSHLCHFIALQWQTLETPLHASRSCLRHLTSELHILIGLRHRVHQSPHNGHLGLWGKGTEERGSLSA